MMSSYYLFIRARARQYATLRRLPRRYPFAYPRRPHTTATASLRLAWFLGYPSERNRLAWLRHSTRSVPGLFVLNEQHASLQERFTVMRAYHPIPDRCHVALERVQGRIKGWAKLDSAVLKRRI